MFVEVSILTTHLNSFLNVLIIKMRVMARLIFQNEAHDYSLPSQIEIF